MSEEQVQPRLNQIDAAVERLGVCRSKVYQLMDTGQLRSVKVGRRRLIPEQAIVDFIASLEGGAH